MDSLIMTAVATTALPVLGFGFLLGLKHATEADHLAAITTLAADRRTLWSSALTGGLWGLGHTVSLLVAGIFVLVLDFRISETAERYLELCVGVMLALLGINVIRKLFSGGSMHFHTHKHGAKTHAHPHIHESSQASHKDLHHMAGTSSRSVLIGMVHGLAGSAALMLLVIPTIASPIIGLLYIVIFGIGSIGGMMLMSFLVGLPFHLTAERFDRSNLLLQAIAGCVSMILGGAIIYEKGFS